MQTKDIDTELHRLFGGSCLDDDHERNQIALYVHRLLTEAQQLKQLLPVSRFGIDELRGCAVFDTCNETFNQQFTAAELLLIRRAHAGSEWDFYPDQWTERQLTEALAGRAPTWDANENPTYDTPDEECNEGP